MQLHTAMLEPRSEKYFDVDTLGKWLSDISTAWLASRAYLIPDTNVLIRRYGSNLVVELTRKFNDLRLYIPRLAILEIESLPRQEKKKGSQNEKWAKRRAFSAFAELIRLRENGAELLPQQIDPRVMQSFSEIAGSGYTDAWIRREVHDFLEKLTSEEKLEHKAKVFFLTSDLLNAFAAIAEGIDTLYLWEPSDKDRSYEANYKKLGKFIVAMSVFFDRISMQIQSKGNTESYELTGVWSGKTIEDWKKDLVEMSKKA
jgi:predicted PilT family ATPase